MNNIKMLVLPTLSNVSPNGNWATMMFQGLLPLTPYPQSIFHTSIRVPQHNVLRALSVIGQKLVRRLSGLSGVSQIVVKPDQMLVEVIGDRKRLFNFMFNLGGIVRDVFGGTIEVTIEDEKAIPIKPTPPVDKKEPQIDPFDLSKVAKPTAQPPAPSVGSDDTGSPQF